MTHTYLLLEASQRAFVKRKNAFKCPPLKYLHFHFCLRQHGSPSTHQWWCSSWWAPKELEPIITEQLKVAQMHNFTQLTSWNEEGNIIIIKNFITFLMILKLISYCCQVGAVSFNKRVHQINIGILTIKIVGQSAFLGLSVDIEV